MWQKHILLAGMCVNLNKHNQILLQQSCAVIQVQNDWCGGRSGSFGKSLWHIPHTHLWPTDQVVNVSFDVLTGVLDPNIFEAGGERLGEIFLKCSNSFLLPCSFMHLSHLAWPSTPSHDTALHKGLCSNRGGLQGYWPHKPPWILRMQQRAFMYSYLQWYDYIVLFPSQLDPFVFISLEIFLQSNICFRQDRDDAAEFLVFQSCWPCHTPWQLLEEQNLKWMGSIHDLWAFRQQKIIWK